LHECSSDHATTIFPRASAAASAASIGYDIDDFTSIGSGTGSPSAGKLRSRICPLRGYLPQVATRTSLSPTSSHRSGDRVQCDSGVSVRSAAATRPAESSDWIRYVEV